MANRKLLLSLALPAALFLTALFLAACQAQPPAVNPNTPAGPDATQPGDLPAGNQPAATLPGATDPGSPEGEALGGPGEFDLPDPAVGLTGLDSYQAALRLTLDAGPEASFDRTFTNRYDRAADWMSYAEAGGSFHARAGEQAYRKEGSGACTALPISAMQPAEASGSPGLEFTPVIASQLPPVFGAEAAGSETLSGTAAQRYTFDQRALALEGIVERASGEVWVAEGSGAVLKYTLEIEAGPGYLGEGRTGTLRYDYSLSQPDGAAEAALPADCPAPPLALPVPPGTEAQPLPGAMSFTTGESVGAVVSFYQAALPGDGWQPQGEPAIQEKFALLRYAREGQVVEIVIRAAEQGAQVMATASGG